MLRSHLNLDVVRRPKLAIWGGVNEAIQSAGEHFHRLGKVEIPGLAKGVHIFLDTARSMKNGFLPAFHGSFPKDNGKVFVSTDCPAPGSLARALSPQNGQSEGP